MTRAAQSFKITFLSTLSSLGCTASGQELSESASPKGFGVELATTTFSTGELPMGDHAFFTACPEDSSDLLLGVGFPVAAATKPRYAEP